VIRLRLLRLCAAVAVLTLTAFTGASASAFAPHQLPTFGLPPGTFLLIGDVARPQILDVAALQAMPTRTITVTFKAGNGTQTHTYVGPRLVDVLAQAGPRFDPAIKNDKLRHFISVGASDNYQALVAYGEIDPSFKNKDVLLATSEDGRSLATDGPRLVVPGDIAGGRYVTNVVRVFLEKPPL
jgi:hypothetical protein